MRTVRPETNKKVSIIILLEGFPESYLQEVLRHPALREEAFSFLPIVLSLSHVPRLPA